MAVEFEYAPGATPIDPDEAAGLIPDHIVNQGQLNEWEYRNVFRGIQWALEARRDILTLKFMYELHQHMFDETWTWAGSRRKSDKTIGVAPEQIDTRSIDLFRDVQTQIESNAWPIDQVAARFSHRLVRIHPFANGNGRHSRVAADLLLRRHGRDMFTWGNEDLVRRGPGRDRYIAALRAADRGDYAPLFAFVRSA